MPSLTAPLPEISQYALGRLDQCGRAFELAHLKRVPWPAPDPLEEKAVLRAKLAVGELFHQLVHWHARGHDVAPLLDMVAGLDGGDTLIGHWRTFSASEHAAPSGRVWSEQTLRTTVGGLRVMARYDRLVRDESGAWTIFDWKTGSAFDPAAAERSWQTRLYRLVLAEAGHALTGSGAIAPEQIQVVYWHVPSGRAHAIPYSRALREEDADTVARVADRLARGLEQGFAPDERHCRRCPYDTRCQLGADRPPGPEAPLVWPTFRFPD